MKREPTAHEKRVETTLRNAQDAAWALSRAKRQAGLQTSRRQASSANKVLACPVCKAMVVDSAVGWRAHWARMPFCAAGK